MTSLDASRSAGSTRAPIDSAGLAHLPRLPSLRQLDLGETAVDDKILESLLRQPRLAQ